MLRIRDLGENALIQKFRERFRDSAVSLGIGDDAAVVGLPAGHAIVYCSDLLAENTHFIRSLHPADSIGYKAVAVNVSDIGAMGAIPMYLTLSIALPGELDAAWLDAFADGIRRACTEFDIELVGGDSSSAERIFVDVSMIGRVAPGREVRRSGAQAGDAIFVTGRLGESAAGLEHLKRGDLKHPSVPRHLYPAPRHRIGQAVASQAHAMIDISDGLSTDLRHILEESGVSARIYRDLLPIAPGTTESNALHGGEDYELLIAAPSLPSEVEGIPIHRIGEIVAGDAAPVILLNDGSSDSILTPSGYQHFSEHRPAQ